MADMNACSMDSLRHEYLKLLCYGLRRETLGAFGFRAFMTKEPSETLNSSTVALQPSEPPTPDFGPLLRGSQKSRSTKLQQLFDHVRLPSSPWGYWLEFGARAC